MLASNGSVLGVDIGYSPKRRSSAVCRLDWDSREVTWTVERFRAKQHEREMVITAIAGSARLEVAAFDGPLRAGFDVIGRYRTAERMLTRRLQPKIGKPGQASAPVGKHLNAAANACVEVVLQHCKLARSAHVVRIDPLAIVEAFPSSFLGVLIKDPSTVAARRSHRSDSYFEYLVAHGVLSDLVARLLPGRSLRARLESVANHDDRAAVVCALTALCVAAAHFTAVGDEDGWIILPPVDAIENWALTDLMANANEEPVGCLYSTES